MHWSHPVATGAKIQICTHRMIATINQSILNSQYVSKESGGAPSEMVRK